MYVRIILTVSAISKGNSKPVLTSVYSFHIQQKKNIRQNAMFPGIIQCKVPQNNPIMRLFPLAALLMLEEVNGKHCMDFSAIHASHRREEQSKIWESHCEISKKSSPDVFQVSKMLITWLNMQIQAKLLLLTDSDLQIFNTIMDKKCAEENCFL